eukprot:2388796-Rhodomonas_salina.4
MQKTALPAQFVPDRRVIRLVSGSQIRVPAASTDRGDADMESAAFGGRGVAMCLNAAVRAGVIEKGRRAQRRERARGGWREEEEEEEEADELAALAGWGRREEGGAREEAREGGSAKSVGVLLLEEGARVLKLLPEDHVDAHAWAL